MLRTAPAGLEMKAPNLHKVPKRQWRKWTQRQRSVFNGVFFYARRQWVANAHPDAPKLKRGPWRTIVWNLAWLAADFAAE